MDRKYTISRLREQGWAIIEQPGKVFQLPAGVAARYPKLPDSLVAFLSGLSACVDQSQTTWFLCQDDYEGKSDSAFRWDEWEQLSLAAAKGDANFITEIRSFWDCHFPFLYSVQSGYAYHAVRTSDNQFGQIVQGYEPEFEEATLVADSFDSFLTAFLNG